MFNPRHNSWAVSKSERLTDISSLDCYLTKIEIIVVVQWQPQEICTRWIPSDDGSVVDHYVQHVFMFMVGIIGDAWNHTCLGKLPKTYWNRKNAFITICTFSGFQVKWFFSQKIQSGIVVKTLVIVNQYGRLVDILHMNVLIKFLARILGYSAHNLHHDETWVF